MRKKGFIQKRYIAVAVISALIVIVFVFSYLKYRIQTSVPEANALNIVYHIDSVESIDHALRLEGWCFQVGDNPTGSFIKQGPKVVLVQKDDNSKLTSYQGESGIAREDVSAYYNDEKNDYTACGFDITIDLTTLEEDKTYEIMLQANASRFSRVSPGLYLRGEKTFSYDPEENPPLNVEGTDLESIIECSELKYYSSEYGICIYQNGWKLYYIADENYPIDDGWGRIGHNVYTSKPELLPEIRVQYGYESLDWTFKDYEITDSLDAGDYRVALWEIPTSYPVTVINTGAWIPSESRWLWNVRICPGIPEL